MKLKAWSFKEWPASHTKTELLADVDAMVEAITESLVARHEDALEGLWLKGSAAKPWDSPIDYVPEVSDIDLHYLLRDGRHRSLTDLDSALELHREIARRFAIARPNAVHIPRPQFVSLTELREVLDYVPSPPATVRTLHGESPGEVAIDAQRIRNVDARNLIEAADPQVLDKAIVDLVERPHRHLYTALRHLNWRTSPLAARTLSVLGLDYNIAWLANRTQAVHLLREHNHDELATEYSTYYEASWDFFLSDWSDEDSGRSAFSAAIRALRLSAEIGRSFDPALEPLAGSGEIG